MADRLSDIVGEVTYWSVHINMQFILSSHSLNASHLESFKKHILMMQYGTKVLSGKFRLTLVLTL